MATSLATSFKGEDLRRGDLRRERCERARLLGDAFDVFGSDEEEAAVVPQLLSGSVFIAGRDAPYDFWQQVNFVIPCLYLFHGSKIIIISSTALVSSLSSRSVRFLLIVYRASFSSLPLESVRFHLIVFYLLIHRTSFSFLSLVSVRFIIIMHTHTRALHTP